MNARPDPSTIEPLPHTAKGEPPLSQSKRGFLDSQGEMFQPDIASHRSHATWIGVLQLDNGKWLSHRSGFAVDDPQFDSREQALRASIAYAIRRFRRYGRNQYGEQWEWGLVGRLRDWALSLKPEKDLRHESGVAAESVIGHQAASDDRLGDHSAPSSAPIKNDSKITDPLVAEYVAQHKARKAFPAGHVIHHTMDFSDPDKPMRVGVCDCKATFRFKPSQHNEMDAAIEAHWQKFEPECGASHASGASIEPAPLPTADGAGSPYTDPDDWMLRLAEKLAWKDEDAAITEPAPLILPRTRDGYRKFLERKIKLAAKRGFVVDQSELNPTLRPHLKLIVPWMMQLGRAALFARFGMQKTTAQLELMRLVMKRRREPALIVLPLGARLEFFKDTERWFHGEHAIKVNFARRSADLRDDAINLTNFESVREGNLDPSCCAAASLDEGDILRSFGGTKTFREFMRVFEPVPFRFVATATPDPNEYIELIAYAGFLDIMDIGQAKTRFFKRNSEQADKLTLHPHKADEFWLWVASWAAFLQRPSDVDPSLSDEGYDLPPLDVRWHELPTDHGAAGTESDGQGKMFRDAASGLAAAAAEKRDSLDARVQKMLEIRAEDPAQHRIVWHDLEAERKAIEATAPEIVTVYGSQELDAREKHLMDFAAGNIAELAGKPMMIGSGSNFQHHCWWAIYLGIGFKFKDFIQSIHRLQRYGQRFEGFTGAAPRVRVDLIYTEAERETRRNLEDKWKRYQEQAERMSDIIRQYGLAHADLARSLLRTIGIERTEARGERWTIVNNDCVEECMAMPDNSVDLIHSSPPFETQYEYTPSYNDFGHSESKTEFWEQMDFLIPELLRVLKPGRNAVIHIKDRIVPGGMTGLGFQTVSPTSDDCTRAFCKHGFAFLGRKTIVTDVVRENNQTYRLGWSEQCKDGTRMGPGMSEYLLIFRKPQTDRSKGYADTPVIKAKPQSHDKAGAVVPYEQGHAMIPGTGYSRARWQLDAHGMMRSSGNRTLAPEDLVGIEAKVAYRLWREYSLASVYDFEHHVACCEAREQKRELPKKFMLMPPHSTDPDVWTDVTRMRTLNAAQHAAGREMHLCPLQFDVVDRTIVQFSMEGEIVFDPFAGLGTVPMRAVKLKRRGLGVELSNRYFRAAVFYCDAAEREASLPCLFGLLGIEDEIAADAAEEADDAPPPSN